MARLAAARAAAPKSAWWKVRKMGRRTAPFNRHTPPVLAHVGPRQRRRGAEWAVAEAGHSTIAGPAPHTRSSPR